jgi:hypothetical protein
MKILPFDKFIISSNLNVSEATIRLKDSVMPYKWYDNPPDSSKLYFGKVSEGNFRIFPIIKKGRNSFIPFVYGQIQNNETGSTISVEMRLHNAVMLVLLFFLCLLSYGVAKHHALMPLFFILFIYGMTVYFFNDEAVKVKNDLQNILQGQIQNKLKDK